VHLQRPLYFKPNPDNANCQRVADLNAAPLRNNDYVYMFWHQLSSYDAACQLSSHPQCHTSKHSEQPLNRRHNSKTSLACLSGPVQQATHLLASSQQLPSRTCWLVTVHCCAKLRTMHEASCAPSMHCCPLDQCTVPYGSAQTETAHQHPLHLLLTPRILPAPLLGQLLLPSLLLLTQPLPSASLLLHPAVSRTQPTPVANKTSGGRCWTYWLCM
jgi:hypothetical protein